MNHTNDTTVEQTGDPSAFPATVADAIMDALEPTLAGTGRSVHFRPPRDDDGDHVVGYFGANYPEVPHMEDGELVGWLPPYRAREQVDDRLREFMPDGYTFEAQNNTETVVYRD